MPRLAAAGGGLEPASPVTRYSSGGGGSTLSGSGGGASGGGPRRRGPAASSLGLALRRRLVGSAVAAAGGDTVGGRPHASGGTERHSDYGGKGWAAGRDPSGKGAAHIGVGSRTAARLSHCGGGSPLEAGGGSVAGVPPRGSYWGGSASYVGTPEGCSTAGASQADTERERSRGGAGGGEAWR
jgi:hypothetical protein